MNHLLAKIGFSSLNELFTFGLSLVFNIIIAKLFGPEGTGEYWIVFNATGLLSVLLSVRFQRSITYHAAAEKIHMAEILAFGSIVTLASAMAIAAILWFVPHVLTSTILKNVQTGLHIIFLIACGRLMELFVIGILEGYMLFRLKAFIFLGQYLFRCLSAALVCGVFGLGLDILIPCIAYGEMIGFAAVLIVAFVLIGSVRYNPSYTKRYLSYSLRSYIGLVADFSTFRPDTFMLNYFWGPNQAGLYAIATSISNIVLYIPVAVKNVLMPYLAGSGNKDVFARVVRRCFLLFTLLGVANFLIWWNLIEVVYGEQFLGARKLICILIPGSIFNGMYLVMSSGMEGSNRPGAVSIVSFATAVAGVVVYAFVIPGHASIGAAAVSTAVCIASFWSMKVLWKDERARKVLVGVGR